MLFDITFTITGPSGKTVEAPNNTNPVEATDMTELLRLLADKPLGNEIVKVIGIRIQETPS